VRTVRKIVYTIAPQTTIQAIHLTTVYNYSI
jgi:hypothetical protein